MQRLGHPLLSLAGPFLILLAIIGLMQRKGTDRMQSIPPLIVGSGLIISGACRRSHRRNQLLLALRKNSKEEH